MVLSTLSQVLIFETQNLLHFHISFVVSIELYSDNYNVNFLVELN